MAPTTRRNTTTSGAAGSQSRSQSFGQADTTLGGQNPTSSRNVNVGVASALGGSSSRGGPTVARRLTAPSGESRRPSGWASQAASSSSAIEEGSEGDDEVSSGSSTTGTGSRFNAAAPAFAPFEHPSISGQRRVSATDDVPRMRRMSEALLQPQFQTRREVPLHQPPQNAQASFSEFSIFQRTQHAPLHPSAYEPAARPLGTPIMPTSSSVRNLSLPLGYSQTNILDSHHDQDNLYCLVSFKLNRCDVYLLPLWTMTGNQPTINSLVMVEADRGSDLGRIVQICNTLEEAMRWKLQYMKHHYDLLLGLCQTPRPIDWDEDLAFTQFFEFNPSHSPLTRGCRTGESRFQLRSVKREATDTEIESYLRKASYEDKAKKLCCQLIRKHGLNVEIVDSEFQLDMHKLTFYFWSPHYLHFSALVTGMLRTSANPLCRQLTFPGRPFQDFQEQNLAYSTQSSILHPSKSANIQ
jgi:hypothetical protein